ncbi:hypothetical protein PCANC_00396 [Puccinia coronata f. sp. avenae]|uniref:Uncharacterized protein n=1 Tax=Puccinia coronata f. sp. avenae TaxID=200324 RepID=A0A2N5W8X8_9BASI|nr:hypothetical protein PCANC_00396 [Puccinia coronata f. sp. avenae]
MVFRQYGPATKVAFEILMNMLPEAELVCTDPGLFLDELQERLYNANGTLLIPVHCKNGIGSSRMFGLYRNLLRTFACSQRGNASIQLEIESNAC